MTVLSPVAPSPGMLSAGSMMGTARGACQMCSCQAACAPSRWDVLSQPALGGSQVAAPMVKISQGNGGETKSSSSLETPSRMLAMCNPVY